MRRPIFLLEVVIAMVLVGMFSIYFLQATIRSFHQERDQLKKLELERLYNLRRMDVIAECFQTIETLPIGYKKPQIFNKKFDPIAIAKKTYTPELTLKAWRTTSEGTYRLKIKEGDKKYNFIVKKEKPGVVNS